MPFTGFYICPECKPEVVRKLATGVPVGSLWKNGNILVALRGVTFPDRCVRCNAPMDSARMYSQTLYWHHPLWYLLLLGVPIYCIGFIIYFFVALVVQKRAKIRAGLCAMHRKRRAVSILAGYGTVLLFAPSVVWSLDIGSFWPGSIGALVMICGIIWASYATRLLAPVKIDATHVHMKGVCRAFLAELPEWPEA